jgi:CRISPR-associated protein Csb1
MNYSELQKLPWLLFEAELKPLAGSRFQPTGFADIGAAEYKLPDGTPMLLVESAQSVANRLERTCLDGDGPDLDRELEGLPYVVAKLTGVGEDIRTSSLVEAHRVASPYFLRNEEFVTKLVNEMDYDQKRARPLNWPKIYATLFKYDPNTLIHGVFLSLLGDGRVRVPRALTGFIEARNVERVVYGGVKNSPVDPRGQIQAVGGKTDESGVYSNVPYSRVEYAAESIKAYFNLDVSLIRGYRLGEDATGLLTALSLLKIKRFLDGHLRLRTACDFACTAVKAPALDNFDLPQEAELLADVKARILKCVPAFANPRVTELNTPVKIVEKAGKKSSASAGGSAQ